MISVVQFPFFNAYSNVLYNIRGCSFSPVMMWLLNGKIAENPVVTPSTSVQIVTPSANNRYLESVKVEAIPTTPGTGA